MPQYSLLSKRIQQQCAIAYCVTEEMYDRAQLMGYDFDRQGLQIMYHECLAMQKNRVLSEYETANAIMHTQANLMSKRSQENYLQEYFVNTGIRTLVDEIMKLASYLGIIDRKFTEGTKQCN